MEETTDQTRFGYHPNGFFHLETKADNAATLVESSFALDPNQPHPRAVSDDGV